LSWAGLDLGPLDVGERATRLRERSLLNLVGGKPSVLEIIEWDAKPMGRVLQAG
jgi:hypothetical protein